MNNKIKVCTEGLKKIRTIDERLVSYNIEMTEVTGGTFWKSYTLGQIEGTETFPAIKEFSEMANMMQVYPPVDLYEEKIRNLSAALGSVYIRVSGSWATNTYYDFDGHTNGVIPDGYRAILTKEQWTGVLDFAKAVNAKLLISVSNCQGDHVGGKPWSSEQAKLLFDYSIEYGVPISAAEFMNEPNVLKMDVPAEGYGADEFARDQDIFFRFIRDNYKDVLLVGPCSCGDAYSERTEGLTNLVKAIPTEELLASCKEAADVYSYHCYAGISERAASLGGHWDAKDANSEEYLGIVEEAAQYYGKYRDKYCPNGQMWVTESADAGCGGNTWASTYLDVIRYTDELGRFSTVTDGIIFHNTLASSDYGLLDHATHLPRPNYWIAYLWNRLVGSNVYDSGEIIREGAHVYTHSRKDGKTGYTYVIVNNSKTETATADIPVSAQLYLLSAEDERAQEMKLNGRVLCVSERGELPEIESTLLQEGTIEIPPMTVAFLVV